MRINNHVQYEQEWRHSSRSNGKDKGVEGLVWSKDRKETDAAGNMQPEGESHATELEGIIMHELCRSL